MNFNYHKPCCKPHVAPNTYKPLSNNPTRQGLGITPSQAMELSQSGHSISLQNFNEYQDGVAELVPDLPYEARRGVDIADAWNASESAKARLKQAHVNDVTKFG